MARRPEIAINDRLPSAAVPMGEDASAAYGMFAKLASSLGGFADEQAKVEGGIAGATEGVKDGYAPTQSATIRGRAYDAAGNAAYQAQTNALFQSDALDLYQKHHNDPTAFKAAYDGLTERYRQRVAATGAHLVGDFTTAATKLGTSLRTRVLDAFDTKQKDQARARYLEAKQTGDTAITRLAATDPDGEATMTSAQQQIAALDSTVNQMVAAGQMTETEAVDERRKNRSGALLTVYAARAEKLTDPDQIDALRKQVAGDFKAGKFKLLDGETWQKIDGYFGKLTQQRRTEFDAATSQYQKSLDDYVDRNAKALTPPANELEALQSQAKALGAKGKAMLAEAQGKLQVERAMRNMGAVERQNYLAKLEDEARTALPSAGEKMTRENWSLSLYKPADLMAPSEGGQFVDARAAHMADRTAQRFFDETGIKVGVNDQHGFDPFRGTAGKRRGTSDPADNPHVSNSRHVHGDAFDFQTQGLSRDQKRRFLQIAREEGFTGVGFYKGGDGHLHLDAGAARTWGEQPDWAQEAMATPARPAGVSRPMGKIVQHARAANDRMSNLERSDPLQAAEQAGIMPGGQAAPLNVENPATLDVEMSRRVDQGNAVGRHYRRDPVYFRAEEKARLTEILNGGGTKALDVITRITKGAGRDAPRALAQLGESAPEMAHATMLAIDTGDATLQRRAAAALEARREPGAKPVKASPTAVSEALRIVAGDAMTGLTGAQVERVKATMALAYEQLARQRGLTDGEDRTALEELARQATGHVRRSGNDYGGYGDYSIGWSSYKVRVPAGVRTAKFGEAIQAITDADITALPDPPVDAKGNVLTAAQLLRFRPHGGDGGYRFGHVDPTTKDVTPVKARSGGIFFLDWQGIAPRLRQRVPGAFE